MNYSVFKLDEPEVERMTLTQRAAVSARIAAHRDEHPRAGDLSTLRRGIEILKVLQQASHTGDGPIGNNRIAAIIGADKSQISRALRILVDSGLVTRDPTSRGYVLGSAAYSLGMRAADQELMRCGSVVIREVVRATGFRGYLVIRSHTEAITLWSEQPATMQVPINSMGMAYPVADSETGRALLFGSSDAEIRSVVAGDRLCDVDRLVHRVRADRREGFAWRGGEGIEGGVAVPVWSTRRSVAAAIGVASPELAERSQIFPAVRVLTAAAADLTEKITRQDRWAVKSVPYFGWPRSPGVIFKNDA
ncbi:IclR family transcriptional regulator [Tsukamurella soli]|uniref:IclR family transcriptional regulator n=1 Tax=Tsukamurella soli TaxID=644556 RepID=A0ABP8K952_9ACTN